MEQYRCSSTSSFSLYLAIAHFKDPAEGAFCKRKGKIRKFLLPAFSSFPKMFFYPFQIKVHFPSHINLVVFECFQSGKVQEFVFSLKDKAVFNIFYFSHNHTPHNKVEGRYTGITMAVHPSVWTSVYLSLDTILSGATLTKPFSIL